MLRVRTIYARSASASARYYARYLDPDHRLEAPGRWVGRQAEDLGLAGNVSVEDLEALLSGYDPVSGHRLGAPFRDRITRHGKLIQAVSGLDGTFSAPKSVSIWWGLTGDPGVLAAAGLLDGYRATSNKRAFDWAVEQGPRVEWVREARWVEDRDRWTSSGVAAGIDMSLAIIAALHGAETASKLSRAIEYQWHRESSIDPFASTT
jgi:hypothetical protein